MLTPEAAMDNTLKSFDDGRLPTDVKPTHYDLVVHTDFEKLGFHGVVTVHLDVLHETSSLTFNTAKLAVTDASATSSSLEQDVSRTLGPIVFDEEHERATIKLPIRLPVGAKVELKLHFSGVLTDAVSGYFYSSWEHDGKTEHYAVTSCEPTAARRVFPCWDEPIFKATFAITLVSRSHTVNLSNMPVISEEEHVPTSTDRPGVITWLTSKLYALTTNSATDKWKITRFQTTPPMSTYTVAFANGPFKYIEDKYESPLSGTVRPLRIYATPDLLPQAQFSLDVKKKVLPHYEQAFDIEFPLPKLDTLVAAHFESGAMENWGLIIGGTNVFLLDPVKADMNARNTVATVTSHEVAHMWFGNITTMAWWDNVYLNEGFASLMGEVVILALDAKLSSHPIEVACPDSKMISQIFDRLSYFKAAAVLLMLSTYVGEETFLKGVSIYLKKHLYANSVTKDLWEGIQEASNIDIPTMMDIWVKKTGYPIIAVTETDDGIHVRQDRFLETGPAKPEDNETIWTVPLNLLAVGPDGKTVLDHTNLLDKREKFIPLDMSKPFKLNSGTRGFYRVLYTPERTLQIARESVKSGSIFSAEDRIGLLQDALALVRAGYLNIGTVLSLCDILRDEKEYLAWASIADSLNAIRSTWYESPDIVGKLNVFSDELFAPLVERLGYQYPADESIDDRQLRTKAIEQSAASGNESVVKVLCGWFKRVIETGDDLHIPPDLLRITYAMALKNGGRAEFDTVRDIAEKTKTPSQQTATIRAMGFIDDLSLAEEAWKYLMTRSRMQDLFSYFSGLQANLHTRHFLVMKFREDYDKLYEIFAGSFSMNYVLEFTHDGLASQKDYDETVAFFENKDVSRFQLSLQQCLDGMKARISWIERSTDDLRSWLERDKK